MESTVQTLLEELLDLEDLSDNYDIAEKIKAFIEEWKVLLVWVLDDVEVMLMIKILMEYCN
jgi:hypothetical protein